MRVYKALLALQGPLAPEAAQAQLALLGLRGHKVILAVLQVSLDQQVYAVRLV